MDQLRYTICFIKREDEVLLLNREKPSWMGSWNGVGGKFQNSETPMECILREIHEETGMKFQEAKFKGIVTWDEGDKDIGGMYLFLIEVPANYNYSVPVKTREGILDWKKISWIMDPENTGIAANVPKYLPKMLKEEGEFRYHCVFKNKMLLEVNIEEI
ncbi:DNA mismatch repair protein MutT [Clostridium acetobutylicum]|nr:DNA mismatch repair protein MutT [Clostridium acetobutylicum]